MYAIVQQGGHQYRVTPGDRLVVDRLSAEVGSVVALEPVLLLEGDAGDLSVGSPTIDGARVAAVVVAHSLGRKIRVFKYKPKKRYRRTMGHRSRLTELRIEALLPAGAPLPERAAAAAETPTAEPELEATPAMDATEAVAVAAPRRRRPSARSVPAEVALEEGVDAEPAAAATDTDPATDEE